MSWWPSCGDPNNFDGECMIKRFVILGLTAMLFFAGCHEVGVAPPADSRSSSALLPVDPVAKSASEIPVEDLAGQSSGATAGTPTTETAAQDADEKIAAESKSSDPPGPNESVPATDWLFFRGDLAGRGFVSKSPLPDQLDVIWEYWEPKCSYETSPVVCDGLVVTADLDGMIRCFQLKDKTLVWKTPTKFGFTASPSIHEQKIYIGDNDGMFRRLDLKTGGVEWEYQTNAQIDSAANFHGGNVIFGSQDASVYGLSTADGSVKWKHTIDDQVRCSIVIDGNRTAVAGCDAVLHVIDAENGTGLAKIELNSQTAVAPTMFGPLAYFGMENGEFVCANMEEKRIVWTWQDERQEASIRGSAAVTDDVVVFGNRGNRVVCLDRLTGEVKWTYRAKRSVEGSALVVGDRVYIGDSVGNLMVLGVSDGKLIQNLELSGGITTAPCLSGDRLLLTTQEGIVYCLGK